MIRISLPFMLKLQADIEPLSQLPPDTVGLSEVFFVLAQAQFSIRELIEGSVYAPYLRMSYPLAVELSNLLLAQTTRPTEEKIDRYQLWAIRSKYDEYRIALRSELGSLNAFFVTQKGPYDTTTLLNWGEALFPVDLAIKVPEAQFDARESAKCIAYEVPTAAAFHVFRVVEAVLRKYYAQITAGAAPPKVRNIGVYLKALEGKGERKILASLKQMTDLHRNPLIHPEAAITLDEAISIAGIGRSAVTAMLSVLPVPAPTTISTPLSMTLP